MLPSADTWILVRSCLWCKCPWQPVPLSSCDVTDWGTRTCPVMGQCFYHIIMVDRNHTRDT